jgi:hypothetical protein
MSLKKIQRLNSAGFAHHYIVPVIAITLIGCIGVYVLKTSNAATVSKTIVIRRATINLKKENSGAQAREDLIKVAAKSDVIGMQEVEGSSHIDAVKTVLSKANGWNVFWPGGAANAVAIAWRTDFVKTSAVENFDLYGTSVTKAHDGIPNVTPNRYVVVASLVDKTSGFLFSNVNGHAIAQAWTTHKERQPLWHDWADAAVNTTNRLAVEKKRITFGSADTNYNKWQVPGSEMHWANHGTYGNAYYDAIWSRGASSCNNSAADRVPINSDHDALVVTFTCPI